MLLRARTEWRARVNRGWAGLRAVVAGLGAWSRRASQAQRGAPAAVWGLASVALGMGALTAALPAAQATLLRHHTVAFVGARGVLFVACWWLALRVARGTEAFLHASLLRPPGRCAGALVAASVSLGLLVLPLVPRGPERSGAADAALVDVAFVTHWAPRRGAKQLVRRGPLLAVPEGHGLLWVDRDGVRHVAPTDTFPPNTHVLMDASARVADFVAAADVAMSRGAHEVVWVLPHEPLEERPPCTPTRYGLTQAMTGALERGPMTIRAVSHPRHASPGVPWADELGALGDMSLNEVLHRGLTVRLQRWTSPQAGPTLRAVMVGGLLASLALGFGLFLLRLMAEALAAGQLARSPDASPLALAEARCGAAVFPAWLPWQRTTHGVSSGGPYRAAPGLQSAHAGVVLRAAFERLRGPLALVVAAMLVLAGALLLAPAP
jgi:hypothetical protein